jgi:xanthine dehydrogenase YagS FAD-binding subunit
MRPFEYASPADTEAALGLLSEKARPFAGGTDLLTLMKADVAKPEVLVDIKRSLGGGIELVGDDLALGALTTLAEIEQSSLVKDRWPALAEACVLAATPQLRNMATIGGNLLQRPRCWYFRSSHFSCWLKGGDECHARDGENQQHAVFDHSPCVAVHPSDPAVALLAYGASVTVRGPAGTRTLALAELLRPPDEARRVENTLAGDELIEEVRVPPLPAGSRSAYLKAMDRKIWAFALVSVAVVVRLDAGKIAEARIALGGVANVPVRAPRAEAALAGAVPDEAAFERAASAALEGTQSLALNRYKLPLLRGLLTQALRAASA